MKEGPTGESVALVWKEIVVTLNRTVEVGRWLCFGSVLKAEQQTLLLDWIKMYKKENHQGCFSR